MTRPAITLVLLPGMDGTGELFAAFVAALGAAAAPLVVSYPADRALGYEGLAAFAAAQLPRDRSYVLLGESFSGPIAIALTATNPPGLAGLILCCSFARNPTPALCVFKRLLGVMPVSAALTGLGAPILLGNSSTPALRRALRLAVGKVSAAAMRARMRAVLEVDYSAKVGAVNTPVLYLQAAQDRLVLAGSARHLATLAPGMRLCRIDGPHQLLQANPVAGALAVQHFIETLHP